MSGTRAVIKFLSLQGKAPKENHAILTETLACFLPSRAKDLSAPLVLRGGSLKSGILFLICVGCAQKHDFRHHTLSTILVIFDAKRRQAILLPHVTTNSQRSDWTDAI